jgi:hypothetical protein
MQVTVAVVVAVVVAAVVVVDHAGFVIAVVLALP